MNLLIDILGEDWDQDKYNVSNDLVQNDIPKSNSQQLQVNNSVLNELQDLEKKHEALQKTIEEEIPFLRKYIINFHENIDSLTRDLNFIKNKSNELNDLLEENSKKLAKISPLVNDLIISPTIIEQILYGKVNSSWVECIYYLNDKEAIYKKYEREQKTVVNNFEQLREVLYLLKNIVLERSKNTIVSCIKKLRSVRPPIPSQQLQLELLQIKEIYQFIAQNNHSLALELRQAYTYTMKWYYSQYFQRYIRSLTILQFTTIDSQYGLGLGLKSTPINGSYKSYLFTNGISLLNGITVTNEMINEYFCITRRLNLLTQEDNTAMVSQIAENNYTQNFLEVGFKNLNLAILDNSNVEFRFLNEFFKLNENIDEVCGLLEQIFQPIFDKSLNYTKQLISSTYDIFGVLICVRIAHRLQLESQKKHIPVIEEYLDSQLILLWPKFQRLIDFQCENLSKVMITTNVANIPGAEKDPLITPHELTVQFSTFFSSMLLLSANCNESIDERSEPLYHSINRICNEFETIMTKCSKKTNYAEKFLSINYMYILNIIQFEQNNTVVSVILQEYKQHFSKLIEVYGKT